jgi:hypothetical protein
MNIIFSLHSDYDGGGVIISLSPLATAIDNAQPFRLLQRKSDLGSNQGNMFHVNDCCNDMRYYKSHPA